MTENKQAIVPSQHDNEEQRTLNELHTIVSSSQHVLMSLSTVFPLDLFPDRLTVDPTQVTITHRNFFFMGDVISIRVEDILSVSANTGPFFGSIQLSTRFYHSDQLYHVNWLWRRQALRLKAIIQGLVVARSREVDLSNLDRPLLVRELIKLGSSLPSEAP